LTRGKTFRSTFSGNFYYHITAQYTYTRLWLGGTEDLNRPVKSELCYLLEVKVFTLFCSFIICTLKYSGYLHFSVFCNYHNLHRFVQCRANVCYKISLYKSQNSKGVANEFLRVKPLYYLKKIDFILTRKRT